MKIDYKEKITYFVLTSSNADDEHIAAFISGMQAQKTLCEKVIITPDQEAGKTGGNGQSGRISSAGIRLM